MLARDFELAAFVLDFVEQSHVFDGDCCLVGKCRNQFDLLAGEWPHVRARQNQHPDRHALTQHWNAKNRAKIAQSLCLYPGIFRIGFDIGDMDHPTFE